jgi:hypothetical protein
MKFHSSWSLIISLISIPFCFSCYCYCAMPCSLFRRRKAANRPPMTNSCITQMCYQYTISHDCLSHLTYKQPEPRSHFSKYITRFLSTLPPENPSTYFHVPKDITYLIVKLPFNAQFTVFLHLTFSVKDPKSIICITFPPFKIFLSLGFKVTAPQRNFKWRCHCVYVINVFNAKSQLLFCKNSLSLPFTVHIGKR